MIQRLVTVPTDLCDYPAQPRSHSDPEYCPNLGQNMKANGQQVPVIGWFAGGRFQLADGGCRLEGARLAGIPELLALDLGKEPTRAELLMAQASIDLHKESLPPVDRARLFAANLEARGCTAKRLAQDLGTSPSLISNHLLLLTLAPDIQARINAGELEWSKGCLIARQTDDPARQRELATEAGRMSREALAAKVRQQRNGQALAAKVARVTCMLPSGVQVVVSGEGVSLEGAIEALGEAIREMKRARDLGYTAKTFAAAMKDKSKKG
jgi:ParB/RepB/Spo0J family partition protein